jgi:hypothetical protein
MQPAKDASQQAGSKELGLIFGTANFKSSLNAYARALLAKKLKHLDIP